MKVFYDLHLHSCLSPCGGDDMTPNNLVNMAVLLGYQLIAVTDHNACGNAKAAIEAGRAAGLVVVPGMELCTAEEAHVVCLFPTLKAAEAFEAFVKENSPPLQNRPEIFGRQFLLDSRDEPVGEEERMLLAASFVTAEEAAKKARELGGTAFPAHVDRDSYSLIASLGAIPPELDFHTAEISPQGDPRALLRTNPELMGKLLLMDSDAHYLENMPDPAAWLELPENTPQALIAVLNGELPARWYHPGWGEGGRCAPE